MKLKVRIDFNDGQREAIQKFMEDFNKSLPEGQALSLEKFCRNAVLYTIQQAYRNAEVQNGSHNAETGDTAGDSAAGEPVQSTNSNILPDESTSSHQQE